MPVPAVDPRRPDTLPAHLYDTQAEFGALLQRAINLRAGSLGHPWYRRQYERAGMRFWLGLVASNMHGPPYVGPGGGDSPTGCPGPWREA